MALNSKHHVSVDQLQTVVSSLTTKADARYLQTADVDNYTLTKATTADTGFLATYQLYKGETAVGDKINIPKDYLVKSVTLETCSVADTPVTGYLVGDVYIDFVINTVENDSNATHLYLKVSDLIDTYTAGNGIDITSNAVSVVVDSSNANGLSVGASGLALATATTTTAGAMSASDKDKLDNADVTAYTGGNGIDITSHAVAAVVDSSNANGLSVGANGIALAGAVASTSGTGGSAGAMSASDKEKLDNADVTAYTGTGAISVSNHQISVGAASPSTDGVGGAAGTMSAADKEKLDDISPATSAEIAEITDSIWPSA